MHQRLRSTIETLPPAYFSMVMATGIVSKACYYLGFGWLALGLLYMNGVFFLWLWLLTFARIFLYPRKMADDLCDHGRGVGFFTVVAGTCVLGSQLVILLKAYRPAFFLLLLGVCLWAGLLYFVFTALTVRSSKPALPEGINGLWLVGVVATQSVAILSTLLAPHMKHTTPVLFFACGMLFAGGMLYVVIITLIFYRLLFFPMRPENLTPPYWITMGAAAITTLAGANLLLNSSGVPFLERLAPVILGTTLLFWFFATWWIPFLLLLGAWRYLIRRVRFSYDPQYWGMVFPLGMYTTCTYRLAQATGLDMLFEIPSHFIYVALLAWLLTFLGFMKNILGSASPPPGLPHRR